MIDSVFFFADLFSMLVMLRGKWLFLFSREWICCSLASCSIFSHRNSGLKETLFFVVGVDGISFEKPASITASAKNTDLETGTNWNIINDGTTAIPHKAIAITRIISKG